MENQETVNAFNKIINMCNPFGTSEKLKPLVNITFFLGAGFSKAWDERYPLGKDLFSFTSRDMSNYSSLENYLMHCGYDYFENINYDVFVEIYYRLGIYRKYPEIRPRFIDHQNIEIIESDFRNLVADKFKKVAPINWVSENQNFVSNKTPEQQNIVDFFYNIQKYQHCGTGIPEGIRPNFITTNYDFVVEEILDSTFDDFHYLNTYRGFTPIQTNKFKNMVPMHEHMLSQSLFKINGGIEIYKDGIDYSISHRQDNDMIPEIILPSKEQDYFNEYFKSIFSKSVRLLQESKILVIIGYSLPKEDLLIRFILRHFMEDARDLADKFIFYIDLGEHTNLKNKIKTIIPNSCNNSKNIYTYNKGFIKFTEECSNNK